MVASLRTVRRWIREGQIPRSGPAGTRRVYVDAADVDRFVSSAPHRDEVTS